MANEQQHDEDYIEIKIPSQEPTPEKDVAKKQEGQKEQSTPKASPKKKKAAKKVAEKKPITPKKAKRKARDNGGSSNWLWAVLLIIGLIVIAAVIYLSLQAREPATKPGEEHVVAALVNNQPIYQDEIDKIHENLPASMGTIEKDTILDQLIEQELLVQEAKKQGLTVSDEELEAYIDELLAYFGVPKDQFDAALEAQGMTREEFERNSERQIIVNKLINNTVYATITIAEDDIAARYEEDKEFFVVPASVTVKHILITAKTNETQEETRERAEDVMDMIDDDFANFCGLVTNYTADINSIQTCGEYEVMQDGQYIPEFEEAAFSMAIGELGITKTDFGYHLIWKIAEDPQRTLALEEVTNQVEAILFQEEASTKVMEYIVAIRDEAVIEKYPAVESKPIVTLFPSKDDQEAKEEVIVEETRPVREGSFGACLAEEGAVLYGVSWAPDVDEQKTILGEAFKEITYVDCDPASGTAPAACDDVAVYPTWIIGSGEDALILKGKQSLNALSRETGCTP